MLRYRSGQNDRYSYIVFFFKIALPFFATMMLLPIFLATKGLDRSEVTDSLSTVISGRYNEPWISELTSSTVLDDGSVMSLRATSGEIGLKERIKLFDVDVVITSPLDEVTTIRSNVGFFSQDGDLVVLKEQVRAIELNGYALSTESVTLSLRSGRLESDVQTTLTSMSSNITGMKFEYNPANSNTGSMLNFSNGVRFIFQQ